MSVLQFIGVLIGGMVIGGTIVEMFKVKIDADVAEIVAAYKAQVSNLTDAHAIATVAAVKAVTPAAV